MAMIELTMRPMPDDELEAEEAPESTPAAAIEQTYFVVPVRLNIDGEELLAYPGVYPDWRPLPVLGFATQLRRTVLGLEHGRSGTITLADGGFLSISRDDANLVFTMSLAPVRVSAGRDSVVAAVVGFSQSACAYVKSIAPAMPTHPAWSEWCPDRS